MSTSSFPLLLVLPTLGLFLDLLLPPADEVLDSWPGVTPDSTS
jgi:hypothetical protein